MFPPLRQKQDYMDYQSAQYCNKIVLSYNKLLDMRSIILLCILIGTIRAQLPFRTGIARLQRPTAKAFYFIPFKSSLLSSTYKSLVLVSYISNFSTTQGIDITSNCSDYSPASMNCSISSRMTLQFSEVYLSYIVSDFGSLQVGTFTKIFNLAYTSTVQRVVFNTEVDPKFINNTNSLFVQFYPLIAGVSCLDGDFSLDIESHRFESLTMEVSMNIVIREVRVKTITVIFGYIIFNGKQVSVGKFEDQYLGPEAVPKGYIYGIKNIRSASIQAPRLLQAFSLSPPTKAVNTATIPSNVQTDPKNNTEVGGVTIDKFLGGSQPFNKVFGTDGFVIMSSETEIDQVYYFEVHPISELYPLPTKPSQSIAFPIPAAPSLSEQGEEKNLPPSMEKGVAGNQ